MSNPNPSAPRLVLGHATLAVRDLEAMLAFYTDVLGFQVSDRGTPGPDGGEMVFISQDPGHHHQIVLVSGVPVPSPEFMMVDHLAFRTDTLDDLRTIRDRLQGAGVEGILHITHGNTWSLYFTDPEGNGLECYVETPFHVRQPFAQGFDLDEADDRLVEGTRAKVADAPDFRPVEEWREDFAKRMR